MNINTRLGSLFVLILFIGTTNSQAIKNAVPDVARPLPLSSVRLTGGPLKHAQDLNADYLLKLEPDRMMAYYRKRAGLEPKAQGYPGWDGDGRNLTGHIAGHYLSGVSLMFAATGDQRFKQRADYIVKEMKEVQDKNGDGYLGAVEGLKEKFVVSFSVFFVLFCGPVFFVLFCGAPGFQTEVGERVANGDGARVEERSWI